MRVSRRVRVLAVDVIMAAPVALLPVATLVGRPLARTRVADLDLYPGNEGRCVVDHAGTVSPPGVPGMEVNPLFGFDRYGNESRYGCP